MHPAGLGELPNDLSLRSPDLPNPSGQLRGHRPRSSISHLGRQTRACRNGFIARRRSDARGPSGIGLKGEDRTMADMRTTDADLDRLPTNEELGRLQFTTLLY